MTDVLSDAESPRTLTTPVVRVLTDAPEVSATPTFASPVPGDVDLTAARLGAQMLGLPLFDQGERVARLLEARDDEGGALYQDAVVQMPRRATKTTSIWAVLIGRAATRPGYRCVVTAQSGNIASGILLEHAQMLIANGYAVESRERGQDHAEGKALLYRNGGREHLDFANGSRIWVVPPDPGAVRSKAADDVVVDEAGELVGRKGQDFLDGVRPTQDTRGPLAQLVVAGTPGKTRDGMFWDLLTRARGGEDPDLGVLDYSARDDEDPEDRAVWVRVHPGPSSVLASGRVLTPLSVLEKRRAGMSLASFAREYLCQWAPDAYTGALDVAAWRGSGADFPAQRPARSVLAFDAPKDGTSCAVLEVWRDEDGVANLEVLAMRPGTSWAARYVRDVAHRLKVPVAFDEIGGNVTIAAELRRMRPPVVVLPTRLLHVAGSAQLFATELREGRVRHFDQSDLTAAVEAATWRPAGRDGRAFGHKPGGPSVSPVVAASLALWHYDAQQPRRRMAIVSAAV